MHVTLNNPPNNPIPFCKYVICKLVIPDIKLKNIITIPILEYNIELSGLIIKPFDINNNKRNIKIIY